MEAVNVFFLVMFMVMMGFTILDFIMEEKDKKLESSQ